MAYNQELSSEEEGRLTDFEVDQIEHCYRSQKTSVYVARCLANLYFTRADPRGNPLAWELSSCGVPVLILDRGNFSPFSSKCYFVGFVGRIFDPHLFLLLSRCENKNTGSPSV